MPIRTKSAGAVGVLASVLVVILSMSLGINVTLLLAAACYLCLIPVSFILLTRRKWAAAVSVVVA